MANADLYRMVQLNDRDDFSWHWAENYNGTGVKGMIVTSKITGFEGNRIFLPAATYRYGDQGYVGYEGIYGHYWSSTLFDNDSSLARDVFFYSGNADNGYDNRNKGLSVRPVCHSTIWTSKQTGPPPR